jgi:hypothetical protein
MKYRHDWWIQWQNQLFVSIAGSGVFDALLIIFSANNNLPRNPSSRGNESLVFILSQKGVRHSGILFAYILWITAP